MKFNTRKSQPIIKRDFNGLTIIIPVRISWFFIPLILFVLYQLTSGITDLDFKQRFHEAKIFYILRPLFLFFIILTVIRSILWLFFGKEIIHINKGVMQISKTILGLGRKKEYEIKNIRNMSLASQNKNSKNNKNNGKLAFDYKGKNIKFAIFIDENEAKKILEILEKNMYFNKENFLNNTP